MLNPDYYVIKDFKFQSGEVLPEIRIEYATFGTKRTDNDGNIINGLLYLHGWSGNYSSVERIKDITGHGNAIGTDKFFIICPTALGSPESSSPSTSGLGSKFPKYTIKDMINAHYFLLTEHLNVKHLKGIIGTSMGGFQVLQWAVDYPDFMDFIIPIETSHEVTGRNYLIFNLMNIMIKEDPDYKEGDYTKNPEIGNGNASALLYLFGSSPSYYKDGYESKEELLEALLDMKNKGTYTDANDVVWRNEAALSYDTKDKMSKIKAKTLVIGINQDQFFPPETDIIPLHEAIKGSKLFIYDSKLGHLGINEIKKAEEVIHDFLG